MARIHIVSPLMSSRSETTREALIRAAEHVFARRGFDVPVHEIHTQAGQRNASALHYHFGSRDGLMNAVFASHALSDADVARIKGQLLAHSDDPRAVVEAVVERQRAMLATPADRDWLRIMSHAQLRAPVRKCMAETLWDSQGHPVSPGLQALAVVVRRHAGHLDDSLIQERTLAVFMFITWVVSDRARAIDEGEEGPHDLLDEDMFIANLVDMAVAALLVPTASAGRRVGSF